MRPLSSRTLAVAATGALAATLFAGPSSAAATTTLNPAKLPRGADVAIPHLEGKTIVDGATRIRFKAPTLRLLGKSGTSYVVGTADRQGAHGQFFRVQPDGTRTKLGRADIFQTELSGDGQSLVSTRVPSGRKTIVTVWSATSGAHRRLAQLQGVRVGARRRHRPGARRRPAQDLALDHEHQLGRHRGP